MRAEIVTTGTELLLGQIDDTNATYLARQLRDLGIDLYFRTTVGDNEVRIAQALTQAMARADVVLVTGGLGPTVDDVTREAVARATGRKLVLMPELLDQVRAFFDRVGSTMTENNTRQAYAPEGCIPIENPVGTAPAFVVEQGGSAIVTMPGVPREMRYLMENSVVPYLQRRLGRQEHIVTRVLRTVAVGESRIDSLIADLERSGNPTVGLSAHAGQTDVRIVAKSTTRAEAEAMVSGFEGIVRERLGAAIYATGEAALEEVVAGMLAGRGETVALAETVTQGELARRMGSFEAAFRGSIVAWDASGLARLLGAQDPADPAEADDGQRATEKVAEAVRRVFSATHGLAVLPGDPGGAWVAIAGEGGVECRRFRYAGRDHRARTWTTVLALEFLRRRLLGQTEGWAP
ncbi:MAG TPA: CinA family nicotinamide mononucleotide deamidase-related protein [Anaerolineae bacterium]|nr:CinA family nicotinamide mononucleotide deamidase-related protein [Anaerolineae bacterium]